MSLKFLNLRDSWTSVLQILYLPLLNLHKRFPRIEEHFIGAGKPPGDDDSKLLVTFPGITWLRQQLV